MPAWLTLVAGANGAGKSTLVCDLPFDAALNPDALTNHLRSSGVPVGYADLLAVQLVEHAIAAAIRADFSIAVETVLSTEKYRRHVTDAHGAGMSFRLIYVTLSSPDLAVARVRERVQAGGHDVPEAKIRERWKRSLDQFGWFAAQADELLVFVNDDASPQLIVTATRAAMEVNGAIFTCPHRVPPRLREVVDELMYQRLCEVVG